LPLWLALLAGILHHDPHSILAIVVLEIADDPYSGMIHFHNRGDPLTLLDPDRIAMPNMRPLIANRS